jgi:heterodisulfide reductase subunit C
MAVEMDLQPNQIMRLAQLGLTERLLRSRAIWLCASCETCATRCPMKVSLAEVVDALRRLSIERSVADRSTGVPQFHQAFLSSVRRNGRAHEMGLIAEYKLRTRRFMDDVPLGARMFLQGKLALLPDRIRGRAEVARALERRED